VATIFRVGLENAGAATVLALLVAGMGWALRRRPALSHCLWLLVLLKLLTPPLWKLPVIALPAPGLAAPSASADQLAMLATVDDVDSVMNEGSMGDDVVELTMTGAAPTVTPAPKTPDASRSWDMVAVAGWVWVLGSGLSLALAFVRVRRFRRVLASAEPAGKDVRELVARIADRISPGRRLDVRTVPGGVSPMVWGLARSPVLILPEDLWSRLDPLQRETLIAHELAHLKRGDDRVRLFELAVTILYWWLPLVWWARRALREAEEQCCDAWVVWAFPSAARTYAEALVDTVDFLNGVRAAVPVAASGFGHPHYLKRRLIMIMRGTTPRALGWGGSLAALALAVTLLPLSPSWAQQPDPKEPRKEVNQERQVKFVFTPAEVALPDTTSEGDWSKTFAFVNYAAEEPAEPSAALKETIARLKKQLKEIQDGGSGKKPDNRQAEAIERAINELERATKEHAEGAAKARIVIRDQRHPGEAADLKVRAGDFQEVFVTRLDEEVRTDRLFVESKADQSPEKNAEREKLGAELKELSKLVAEKADRMQQAGKELAEAQRKLAEASRKLAAAGGQHSDFQVRYQRFPTYTAARPPAVRPVPPVAPQVPTGPVPPQRPEQVRRLFAGEKLGERIIGEHPQSSEQERRLSDLEKKLDKILGELDALKRDGSRESPKR
jgi:bla regulator protein blaR1